MKNLGYLYHRAKKAIHAKHYQFFLDKQEYENILKAEKEKSLNDLLYFMRKTLLNIIEKLKKSHEFCGEPKWQAAFELYADQLKQENFSKYQVCTLLCNVDDLLEIAFVVKTVREDILKLAKQQSILTEEKEKHYNEAKNVYLEHREKLLSLENQVTQVYKSYRQLPGLTVPQSIPRELPIYPLESLQTQFSENHVKHLIQVEGSSRIVYQDLMHEINKPPIDEKLSHEIKLGRQRLNNKTDQILEKTNHLNQEIRQDTSKLVEHRTKVMFAHVNRIEILAVTLEKIIGLLFSEKQNKILVELVKEAKIMLDYLQTSTHIDSNEIQGRLLALEEYRKNYEKTLNNWRNRFFGPTLIVLCQREKINLDLQNYIAELIIPACGLQDQQSIPTKEQIKEQHMLSLKLTLQTDLIHSEAEKIQKIGQEFNP